MSRILTLVAVLTLAVVAAGCGSKSPSEHVAQLTSATTTTTAEETSASKASPQAFSKCMRSHGVPNFPDPKIDANGNAELTINGSPGSGLNPASPQFKAAGKACEKLQPGGQGERDPAVEKQQLDQMLKFSGCMRAHGLTKFPDPEDNGRGIHLMLGSGLDPRSPIFKAAQKACEKLMPKPPQGGKGGVTSRGTGGK